MNHRYEICGLQTDCDFRYNTMINRAEKYLSSENARKPADITIPYREDALEALKKDSPHLSLDECEVIVTTSRFYRSLLRFQGFMLHSSAVVVDNKAYLFSAPSGTGKSTHTRQWLKLFGSRACILNDDKPAICIRGEEILACGTPWSGKSDQNVNLSVPLQGICVLTRSAENHIEPLEQAAAIYSIMNQTLRPGDAEGYDILLGLIDRVITKIPLWKMGCNISTQAAQTAYDAMSH